jgi:Mg2+ and Co2+ transporter CorA
LRNFGGISDIINQSRIQNDLVEYVQDQYIRYTNYKNFDYLSLLFISAHGRHIHFQIVFNENYVFFITSEYDSDSTKIIKDIKKNVNKIIANVEINNEIIGRIFLLILDIIIQHYSLILEMVEDNIEIIQEKLNSTKQIQSFTKKIQDTKKIVYSLKKNIRAFASLPPEIELNANEYILGRNRYVLQTIKHRINNLVKFSESVYSFVEELIRQYDSKINNQTNILVMRLTS